MDKGAYAEYTVFIESFRSYFFEWCYLNPLYKGKELCDILIIFQDVAIIIQVKNTSKKQKHILKNERQLLGCYRKLSSLDEVIITSKYKGTENINLKKIKRYFLISVLGFDLPFNPFSKFLETKRLHTMSIDSFTILVNELDTMHDLVNYFDFKETFRSMNEVSLIKEYEREEDFLASFISGSYKFKSLHNRWNQLKISPEYNIHRKSLAKSYYWDSIIDYARHKSHDHKKLTKYLAFPSRLYRESLVTDFLEGCKKSLETPLGSNFMRRCYAQSDSMQCGLMYLYTSKEMDSKRIDTLIEFETLVLKKRFPEGAFLTIHTSVDPSEKEDYNFCLVDQDVEIDSQTAKLISTYLKFSDPHLWHPDAKSYSTKKMSQLFT